MFRISVADRLVSLFILFIAFLLVLRITYSDTLRYSFLLWNLFLAWVPFQLSLWIARRPLMPRWQRRLLLIAWLLFFPNALYIITDLIHLRHLTDRVPVWFDALLLFAAALCGLLMALVALYQVERSVFRPMGKRLVTAGVITALFLGSFGVYLGRFMRWNSWQVITEPDALMYGVLQIMAHPFAHTRLWVLSLLFTVFFYLLYHAVKVLPRMLKEA